MANHLGCGPEVPDSPIRDLTDLFLFALVVEHGGFLAGQSRAQCAEVAVEPSRRGARRAARDAGEMWAYDLVFDACANSRQLKCLTGIDEFTREALAIDVAYSIRSDRLTEVLAKLVSVHGAPGYLRSDNGSEFLSRAILRWLAHEKIETALIDPGKPWQIGTNE